MTRKLWRAGQREVRLVASITPVHVVVPDNGALDSHNVALGLVRAVVAAQVPQDAGNGGRRQPRPAGRHQGAHLLHLRSRHT